MNVTQRGIVTLLRSAITGGNLQLPADFDIAAALPLIQKHHMVTMVYDGAVRCGISRELPAMVQLFQGYCRGLQICEGQMREFARVCCAFNEAGIDYMPLKGSRMRKLYPKPELRLMGDADILIRMEQFEKIVHVMEQLGFVDHSDSDHELIFKTPGLYLELHKRLIPSYNRDLHAYFGDGWQLAKVKNGNQYAMTAEDEMIYLFSHFAKHYRDGGVGCRYVVDLWVYRRAHPELDENYVEAEMEKLQLLEFYRNVRRLIAFWFEGGPVDAKLELMTEYIFASGSWGQLESRVLSVTIRESKRSILGFSGRLVYIRRKLFPGVAVLRRKYTILQKAPWMLPVVWLIRPFYKVLFERKQLDRQKQELKTLDKQALREQRRMLEYVGLEYHF